MTWNSEEDIDFTESVGSALLKDNLENKMNAHSIRTVIGLAILFIIGGLQALHGIGGWSAWIDMALPVLLAVEHTLNGKTS